MDQKEWFGELTALVHAAAARLDVEAGDLAKAFETGGAGIDFVEDEDGRRALLVSYRERQAAVTPDDLAQAVRAIRDAAAESRE